jgi:hypothetical protein
MNCINNISCEPNDDEKETKLFAKYLFYTHESTLISLVVVVVVVVIVVIYSIIAMKL